MAETVRCPGCRRRVRVPAGADLGRSRCSKCRTRLRPSTADAYELFASTSAIPAVEPPPPAEEPISLDECEPISTPGAATVELPPPFKVPARVTGKHPLRGPVTAVLTPFGVFVEREANRPLAFAPVGTKATADGPALRLAVPGGPFVLVLPTPRLAADAAAFLAGARPVPGPVEYPRPGGFAPWVVLLTLILTAAAFVGGVALYVVLRPAPVVEGPPPAPPPSEEPPPDEPPPPPRPPAEPDHPPSYLDLADRDGVTRLPDGPAVVTALAVVSGGETVVGYADGTTWAFRLDQPTFEPPRVGPRASGAVRRIEVSAAGDVAYLTTDTGLCVAGFRASRATVVVPGHPIAATAEPGKERFAAVRGDELFVRYVPLGLAKDPPTARVKGGFVTATAKDETLPANTRPKLPAAGTTFVAWQPGGKLVYGSPDGTITAFPTAVKAVPVSRAHKAPVRAWAVGPTWPDFATGDENGTVGVWPEKAAAPYLLRVGLVPVTQLAFSPCGGELAVADAAGAVSVWNLPTRARVFELVRPAPVVVAYGPRADVLLLSDGKAVEVWSLAALAERAGATWP